MGIEEIRPNLFSVRNTSYGRLEGNGGMIRRPDGGVSAVTAAHVVVDGRDGSMVAHDLAMHPSRNETQRISFRRCRGFDTASLDRPNETEGIPLATQLNPEEALYLVGAFHPQNGLPFNMPVKLLYFDNTPVESGKIILPQGGERIHLTVVDEEKDEFLSGMSGSLIVNARGEAVGLMQESALVRARMDGLLIRTPQAFGTILSLKSLEPIE